jgi:hypothetical protein
VKKIGKPLSTNMALVGTQSKFTITKVRFATSITKYGMWVQHNPTPFLHFLNCVLKHTNFKFKLWNPNLLLFKLQNKGIYFNLMINTNLFLTSEFWHLAPFSVQHTLLLALRTFQFTFRNARCKTETYSLWRLINVRSKT